MASPIDYTAKTSEQFRDDYLRTIQNGLFGLGIPNPNVGEGTYDHVRGTALGQIAEDISNQALLRINSVMPDSAEGEDLVRVARRYGLGLRTAGPSAGFLVLESLVTTLIPEGGQLIDPNGLSYRVRVQGNYANGSLVPITAIDNGTRTNLPANTTLRWVSPPPFVASSAKVSSGGLSGGVDAESYEGLRSRLLDYLAHPPGGGNWSQVNDSAERSSSFVAKAFCYPCVYGPSTMHVACAGGVTATDRDRSIPNDILINTITPAILADFPQFADITVTGCAPYIVNTAFRIAIPTSRKASPPGIGGGWLDGNPFPQKSTFSPCAVQTAYSSVDFEIESDVSPTIGDTVCYVSPVNYKYYQGVIKGFSDLGGGVWRIQIDTPFYRDDSSSLSIQSGDWVFPGAENSKTYVQTVLDTFAGMGPAEKTENATLILRGARKPPKESSFPAQIGGVFLRALVNSSNEVLDATYATAPLTVPVRAGYQLAPYIAVPGKIAFYP